MLPPLKTAVNLHINEDSEFGSRVNLHNLAVPLSTQGRHEQNHLERDNSKILVQPTASQHSDADYSEHSQSKADRGPEPQTPAHIVSPPSQSEKPSWKRYLEEKKVVKADVY